MNPLHVAALEGMLEKVRLLISAGADINEKDYDGDTLLHHSALKGHTEIVKALIAAGADINVKGYREFTPLHQAIQFHFHEIQKLVSSSSYFNSGTEFLITPLHLYFINDNVEIVKALISAGADVNAKDFQGQNPLHHCAFEHTHSKIVQVLITAGANVNAKDKNGNTPLHFSTKKGHLQIVKALITAGADVNAKNNIGCTPLHYVGNMNLLKIVNVSMDYINNMEDSKIVKVLIEAGADVDAKNNQGWTPLHDSTHRKHLEVVKALINAGADVNAKNDRGKIPLHYIDNMNDSKIVKVLIAAGADVNAKDENLCTPLHFIHKMRHLNNVKILIASGAEINAKDKQGRTPLHQWVYRVKMYTGYEMKKYQPNFMDILKSLIAAGADVSIEDNDGKTAIDIVDGNKEICKRVMKCVLLYTNTSKKPKFKNGITIVNEILQQVKELKETFLGSSDVSLFEFLTETDENKTALYSSEESFGMKTVMNSASFRTTFSIFTEDIEFFYFKGIKRADLLVENQSLLKKYTVCKVLPVEIVTKITERLDMEDLETLAEALILLAI